MKKSLLILAVCLVSYTAFSQAFQKSTRSLTIYMGGANMFHIPTTGYSGYGYYGSSFYSPITGQLGVEMEFGVHKYVGVGFNVGVGGRAGSLYWGNELNVPVGAFANFHWWQLLDDKVGKDLKSDKLDIYAGLDLGSGAALHIYNKDIYTDALVFVGPHVGIKYYVSPKFAIGGELGYGKTFANFCMTMKLK